MISDIAAFQITLFGARCLQHSNIAVSLADLQLVSAALVVLVVTLWLTLADEPSSKYVKSLRKKCRGSEVG